jgi:uncharacterized membrane protein YhhN
LSRIVFWAALVGGISYVGGWFLDLPPGWSTAWKGTGVGLLALYAALNARSLDGWLLAVVMAFAPWATSCSRPTAWSPAPSPSWLAT